MIVKNQLTSALLFILLMLGTTRGIAQNGSITLKGKVVEAMTGAPVAFATVAVVNEDTGQPISGTTTLEDGTFSMVTDAQTFRIEVSYIGFQTQTFGKPSGTNTIDLGTISLEEDAQQLAEVVVEGEVSSTEFQLDKRVFNVGKDLVNAGASALDVLNNVPSVNVNIEGQISLRGSAGVQVLINGKPSVMASDDSNALGTLTADMIERVEVITNPSAKYDAEGTSGIINIVIKKEERKGLNGSVSVNAGAPSSRSVGLSLNRRTEKFNLFTQMGVGYKELPNDIEIENTDLANNIGVTTNGEEFRNEEYYNITLGSDYYVNESSVITLSGYYALEKEDQPSDTYMTAYDGDVVTSEWRRTETTEATNPKFQYELNYKKEFNGDEEHILQFTALGSFFGKDQSSEFDDVTVSGADQDGTQLTRTDFKEASYTFKLDYAQPFSEEWSMETGAQYLINDVSNDYEVQDLINGNFVIDPDLTNVFEYNQKVLGIYGSGAYEGEKWGVKAGLRIEHTDLNTLLANTGEENDQHYLNLFPSAHVSYKFTETISFQAGYSKRIYRPGLWDLNPFFNIRNDFNIRQGNPDLQPEFTDSYELTTIFFLGSTPLNLGVYHRYTTEVIERVTFLENNVNITRPENIGTNNATGIELNTKYSPANWLTFNLDFNYGAFMRKGSFESTSFDFNGNSWNTKLLGKVKLPWEIDFEATGNYNSAYKTVQGEVQDQLFMDLGVRKKMFKGKAVVSLSVRDVFASRVDESYVTQPTYEVHSRRQRGRFFSFGFSYGFGKGEAIQYTGR